MVKVMKFKDLPVDAHFVHLGRKKPILFKKCDASRALRFTFKNSGDAMDNYYARYRLIPSETKVLRIY